ncbi:MAG: site-2 protease family protein [Thermoleophilia bacterium]|nr:site-2 protease family protein [Thermoleophilia bacterium]MDH3725540.1 site-2 protease family protein [Thermoleophilia bacterium]
MTRAVGIGRLAGVRVEVDWTWLLVFSLMTWALADAVFPEQSPGLSQGTYWAMAVVGTLTLFFSLLLHELGHSVQARREGMEIEGITLWLFGGVARFRGAFPSARAELRIALAGPAVTVVLAVLYGAVATLGLPESIHSLAIWLASINVVLLVFNMLPGLPLDGGRVARAVIWEITDDFDRATHIAGRAGQLLAYFLMSAGVALTLLAGVVSGIWLAIIGWFLLGASRSEIEQADMQRHLGGLSVADLMVRDPVTVPADMSLARFLDEVVWRHRYTSYPVLDESGHPAGLIAFRRLTRVPREQLALHRVGQHALALDRVVSLAPETPLIEAMQEMGARGAGRALVVANGRLVGLISSTDVLRALEARQAGGAAKARASLADTR